MITIAQQLCSLLEATEKSVKLAKMKISSGKFEKYRLINEEFVTDNNLDYRNLGIDPTKQLSQTLNRSFIKALKNEVEKKRISKNVAYISYLNDKLSARYKFLINQAQEYLDVYFIHPDKAKRLIFLLTHKPYVDVDLEGNIRVDEFMLQKAEGFTQSELIEAIFCNYIKLLNEVENTISGSNPSFVKHFLQTIPADITNDKLICLNYGSNNYEVIKILYNSLNGKYINLDFSSFHAHFTQSEKAIEKIKWSGTLPQLAFLFTGGLTKKSIPFDGLRIKNRLPYKMLEDNFCKSTGSDFAKNYARNAYGRTCQGPTKSVSDISTLIDFINDKFSVPMV